MGKPLINRLAHVSLLQIEVKEHFALAVLASWTPAAAEVSDAERR
jgi:hypothetical protein